MFSSKYLTPQKGSNVRTAGGVRKSRWAALADSDSDSSRSPSPARSPSPPPAPKKAARRADFQSPVLAASPPRAVSPPAVNLSAPVLSFAADPIMAALQRGDLLWGDVMYMDPEYRAAEDARIAAALAAERAANEALLDRWAAAEGGLWEQPFARNLEMHFGDCYDLTGLTDAEYEAFMRYVYANGFAVTEGGRTHCSAFPADEEPRVWTGPDCFEVAAPRAFDALRAEPAEHKHSGERSGNPCGGCCSKKAPAPLSAPGSDAGRRKGAPVPRFCRAAGACADEGCRYVHGDTIPRVNKPCGFGADCGASDPTGVKRSQCLFMHPGETWNSSMVIRRPK